MVNLVKTLSEKFPAEVNALINDRFIIITTGAMLVIFPFVFMYRGKRQGWNEYNRWKKSLHCRRAHTICSTRYVLEHLNHRVEIRFNYTCNNFKVSMGRETICMLISMTVVMTYNKSNICCLIKSDIKVLPKSAFAIRPETTCYPGKSFWERFWQLMLVM